MVWTIYHQISKAIRSSGVNGSSVKDSREKLDNEKAENEVVEKLKSLTAEPRDNTHLRIVLLVSGGHFAGCVFDGDAVVAHKTFHRLEYASCY